MTEEMSQTKRRFTKEFKEEAVRLSEQSDLPIRQVAANLGDWPCPELTDRLNSYSVPEFDFKVNRAEIAQR